MNEAEKVMHDFKQALGQVVFYHLERLGEHFQDDDAVSIIGEELEKMRENFTSSSSASLFSSLLQLETEWQTKYKDYASQNKYQAIREAEEVLGAIQILKSVTEDVK